MGSSKAFKNLIWELTSLCISFLLILLKLLGLISWPWSVVTFLLWAPIAFIACLFAILFLPGLLFLLLRDKKWDERQ